MNTVILKGRLVRDPEVKYTQSGMATCRITVACDRYTKDGNQADFISCTSFNKNAENIGKFFAKGSEIIVKGSIKTGSYEKNGQKVYTTDVWVEGFEFCGSKNQQASSPVPAAAPAYQEPAPSFQQVGFQAVDPGDMEGDIPF